MAADTLSVLSFAGSVITLVGAIWKVAEAKAEIQNKIDRADVELDKKIDNLIRDLEDRIKDLESRYELTSHINANEDKNYKLILEGRLNTLLDRYRNLKQDLYDVQRHLQSSQGFKLKFNSPTLDEKEGGEN